MKFKFIEKGIKKGDRVFYTRKRGTYIGYGEIGTALQDPDEEGNLLVFWDISDPCRIGGHKWTVHETSVKKI